jgi:predicted TIM-barrel fold metal-dependent hydrolase
MKRHLSRRQFLLASGLGLLASAAAAEPKRPDAATASSEPIIDIHQHTNYSFRTDDQLLAHQKSMGVTQTILLPAGSLYGLNANCTGNEAVWNFALDHPGEYFYFANEVPNLPGARAEIEKYLNRGALGIGEQKFHVDCDSPSLELMADIAHEFKVPILMHFQHNVYNLHIERMHKTLEKFPKVKFIGHAQTWWSNIDKNCDQTTMYPTSKVTPGGITDILLSEYPNMYGDLSAGSGLNALNRDPDFMRGFLERHQDKLLYGSDCNDVVGRGPDCQGARTIATLRELAPSKAIERKMLYENAKKMFRL